MAFSECLDSLVRMTIRDVGKLEKVEVKVWTPEKIGTHWQA